jgi:hypothetical protein
MAFPLSHDLLFTFPRMIHWLHWRTTITVKDFELLQHPSADENSSSSRTSNVERRTSNVEPHSIVDSMDQRAKGEKPSAAN